MKAGEIEVSALIPLTEDRRDKLRGLAKTYGFRIEFHQGRDTGRQYIRVLGVDGNAGYTAAMMVLDPVVPRAIVDRGGFLDSTRWEVLLWVDPTEAEYRARWEEGRLLKGRR